MQKKAHEVIHLKYWPIHGTIAPKEFRKIEFEVVVLSPGVTRHMLMVDISVMPTEVGTSDGTPSSSGGGGGTAAAGSKAIMAVSGEGAEAGAGDSQTIQESTFRHFLLIDVDCEALSEVCEVEYKVGAPDHSVVLNAIDIIWNKLVCVCAYVHVLLRLYRERLVLIGR